MTGQALQPFPGLVREPGGGAVRRIGWSVRFRTAEQGPDQPDLSLISLAPFADQEVKPHRDPAAEGHGPVHGIRKDADNLAAGRGVTDQPVL